MPTENGKWQAHPCSCPSTCCPQLPLQHVAGRKAWEVTKPPLTLQDGFGAELCTWPRASREQWSWCSLPSIAGSAFIAFGLNAKYKQRYPPVFVRIHWNIKTNACACVAGQGLLSFARAIAVMKQTVFCFLSDRCDGTPAELRLE